MKMTEVPPILPSARPAERSTSDDDLSMQSAALTHVLDVYPGRITVAELIREFAGDDPDLATKDAIERAVWDLSGVGLLHLEGNFLSPTRAATRDRELLGR